MSTSSILIRGGDVVTVDAERRVYRGGYVLTRGSRIAAVGPAEQTPTDSAAERIDATGCVVVPGLINTHYHHWYNLFKGLGDGMSILEWMTDLLAPAGRHLSAHDLGVASQLGCLEMLRTGTTTSLNHQVSTTDEEKVAAILQPVISSGVRQVFAKEIRPEPLSEQLGLAETVYRRWDRAGDGRVRIGFAVESSAAWARLGGASDELTPRGNDLAVRLGAPITGHVSTGAHVRELHSKGVLHGGWVLAHAIATEESDFELIAGVGASVSHTPSSESARGGGIAPIRQMLEAGVNVALGTDGPMVDATVDMVEQMKLARLLQNQAHADPMALSPETVLEMATIRGAVALGLADEVGALEAGKRADLAIFDLATVQSSVWHKPVSSLVHSARGTDARWVIVDGDVVLRDGRFTRIDDRGIKDLLEEARARSREVIDRAGLTHLLGAPWTSETGR